jgi:hypothetical protein
VQRADREPPRRGGRADRSSLPTRGALPIERSRAGYLRIRRRDAVAAFGAESHVNRNIEGPKSSVWTLVAEHQALVLFNVAARHLELDPKFGGGDVMDTDKGLLVGDSRVTPVTDRCGRSRSGEGRYRYRRR